jgi:hypothetical protein
MTFIIVIIKQITISYNSNIDSMFNNGSHSLCTEPELSDLLDFLMFVGIQRLNENNNLQKKKRIEKEIFFLKGQESCSLRRKII